MLLTFDVGNTETTLGLYHGAELRAHWRIMTEVARTPDEFGVLLRGLLAGEEIALQQVDGVAIGSVVPQVTAPLAEVVVASYTANPAISYDGDTMLLVLAF